MVPDVWAKEQDKLTSDKGSLKGSHVYWPGRGDGTKCVSGGAG